MRRRHVDLALIAFIIIAAIPALSMASETVNYSYDSQGRLITVERKLNASVPVVTNYTFDKAGNRINKTTVGSANAGPP